MSINTPVVRHREQPAAPPGLAAIITLAWPSFMPGRYEHLSNSSETKLRLSSFLSKVRQQY